MAKSGHSTGSDVMRRRSSISRLWRKSSQRSERVHLKRRKIKHKRYKFPAIFR
jgi:hypothetical protein